MSTCATQLTCERHCDIYLEHEARHLLLSFCMVMHTCTVWLIAPCLCCIALLFRLSILLVKFCTWTPMLTCKQNTVSDQVGLKHEFYSTQQSKKKEFVSPSFKLGEHQTENVWVAWLPGRLKSKVSQYIGFGDARFRTLRNVHKRLEFGKN